MSCLYLMRLAQAGTCNLQDGLVSYHLGSDTTRSVHHSFVLIFKKILAHLMCQYSGNKDRAVSKVCWEIGNENTFVGVQQFHPLKFYRKVLFIETREPKDLTHTHISSFIITATLASVWVSLLLLCFSLWREVFLRKEEERQQSCCLLGCRNVTVNKDNLKMPQFGVQSIVAIPQHSLAEHSQQQPD